MSRRRWCAKCGVAAPDGYRGATCRRYPRGYHFPPHASEVCGGVLRPRRTASRWYFTARFSEEEMQGLVRLLGEAGPGGGLDPSEVRRRLEGALEDGPDASPPAPGEWLGEDVPDDCE